MKVIRRLLVAGTGSPWGQKLIIFRDLTEKGKEVLKGEHVCTHPTFLRTMYNLRKHLTNISGRRYHSTRSRPFR